MVPSVSMKYFVTFAVLVLQNAYTQTLCEENLRSERPLNRRVIGGANIPYFLTVFASLKLRYAVIYLTQFKSVLGATMDDPTRREQANTKTRSKDHAPFFAV